MEFLNKFCVAVQKYVLVFNTHARRTISETLKRRHTGIVPKTRIVPVVGLPESVTIFQTVLYRHNVAISYNKTILIFEIVIAITVFSVH